MYYIIYNDPNSTLHNHYRATAHYWTLNKDIALKFKSVERALGYAEALGFVSSSLNFVEVEDSCNKQQNYCIATYNDLHELLYWVDSLDFSYGCWTLLAKECTIFTSLNDARETAIARIPRTAKYEIRLLDINATGVR